MEFVTKVNIDRPAFLLSHGNPIVSVGSCFAAEMGCRLRDRLFDIDINPTGTMFNPASIADTLTRILDRDAYRPDELVKDQGGVWHLMSHHSIFSSSDPDAVIGVANARQSAAAAMLQEECAVLIVTFGSARAFRYLATGKVAGNCHKLPAREFALADLSLEEILAEWNSLITRLKSCNPSLRIIITVSPVRHKAYGLVADRLSKSTLILACHRLKAMHPGIVEYFPAYEIFTDELRDYRFYAADMVHPSDVGADYVFERFADTYLNPGEQDLCRRCLSLTRRLSHRRLGERNAQAIEFEEETTRQAEALAALSPRITKAIQLLKKEK